MRLPSLLPWRRRGLDLRASPPQPHNVILLALTQRVLRDGLPRLDVTAEALPGLIEPASLMTFGVDMPTCFTHTLAYLAGANGPHELIAGADGPDTETSCGGRTRTYCEGDRIVVELLSRNVRPKPPAQERPLNVTADLADWARATGRSLVRITRGNFEDCLPPLVCAHSRFDADACYAAVVDHLGRITADDPLRGPWSHPGSDADVLVWTDGQDIFARRRSRGMPNALWTAYVLFHRWRARSRG